MKDGVNLCVRGASPNSEGRSSLDVGFHFILHPSYFILDVSTACGIVTYTLPYPPLSGIRVAGYLDPSGRSPFRREFDDLDAVATARVSSAL